MAPFHDLLKVSGIGVARAKLIAAARFNPYLDEQDFQTRFTASDPSGKWPGVQKLLASKELCVGKDPAEVACLDVNSASKWKLAEKEGVDEATAQKIVADRTRAFADEADMKARIEAQTALNGHYHWPALHKLLHDPAGLCFTSYPGAPPVVAPAPTPAPPPPSDLPGGEATDVDAAVVGPSAAGATPTPAPGTADVGGAAGGTADVAGGTADVGGAAGGAADVAGGAGADIAAATGGGTTKDVGDLTAGVSEAPTPAPLLPEVPTPAPLPATPAADTAPTPAPADPLEGIMTPVTPAAPAPAPLEVPDAAPTPAPLGAPLEGPLTAPAPTPAPLAPPGEPLTPGAPTSEAGALTAATLGPALDKANVVAEHPLPQWHAEPSGVLSWDPAKSQLALDLKAAATAAAGVIGTRFYFKPQDLQMDGATFQWKSWHNPTVVLLGDLTADHLKVAHVKADCNFKSAAASGTTRSLDGLAAPAAPPEASGAAAPPTGAAQPPSVAAEPPMSPAQPPVVAAEPPMSPAEPAPVTAQPPTDAAQPLTGAAQPPTGAAQPPTGAAQPPTGAAQPPTGAAQPPTGAAQPPTGAAQPPTGAAQPPTGAAPPPMVGSEATTQDVRPHVPQVAANSPETLGPLLDHFKILVMGAPSEWNLKPQGELTWDAAKSQLSLYMPSTQAAPSSVKGSRYFFNPDACQIQGDRFEWKCYHFQSLVLTGALQPDHLKVKSVSGFIGR